MNYYGLMRFCENKSFMYCKKCPYKKECKDFRERYKTLPGIMHGVLSQEFEKDDFICITDIQD